MGRIIAKILSGSVRFNRDRWDVFLDWIEIDLAKRFVFDQADPEVRAFWFNRFEAFSRGRALGQLDSPEILAIVFVVVKATGHLTDKFLEFFGVEFGDTPVVPALPTVGPALPGK